MDLRYPFSGEPISSEDHLGELVEPGVYRGLTRVVGIPLFPFELEHRNAKFLFRPFFDEFFETEGGAAPEHVVVDDGVKTKIFTNP